jgi:hypothetical protein
MSFSITTLSIVTVSIERHYAECHYAECHHAECHDYINLVSNDVMLNVVMLSVVAPFHPCPQILNSRGDVSREQASPLFTLNKKRFMMTDRGQTSLDDVHATEKNSVKFFGAATFCIVTLSITTIIKMCIMPTLSINDT